MRFENYILNEARTASATNMELAIVNAWNKEKPTFKELESDAKNVVKYLKACKLKGKAEHLGSGNFSTTKLWQKHSGSSDDTPKTDLIIGDRKISLKKHGGSQLMSGGKSEATATIFSVLDTYEVDVTYYAARKIKKYLESFAYVSSELNTTQLRDREDKYINEVTQLHGEVEKYFNKIFSKADFKSRIVHEATSGNLKFGRKSKASAGDILVFGEGGRSNEFKKINLGYAKKISGDVKVSVSFKSMRPSKKSKYSIYSSLRLIKSQMKNEMKKYEGEMLTEGIISDIIKKVKDWFKKFWDKVSEWLSKSVSNVLLFLGMEPDVSIDGNLSF